MDLRQLQAFVSVATLRSFRAAANRLNLTQPAISLRISALEAELGVDLFERSKTMVRPTSRGLELLGYAEQVLDSAQRLKESARQSTVSQVIRLGATSTIVHAWLTELLRELRDQFPGLLVELTIDSTRKLREMLAAGELDVAVMTVPVRETGISHLSLCTYQTAWVASHEIAAQFDDAVLTLADIARHWIVTHTWDFATHVSLEETFRMNGLTPVQVSTSNSIEVILRLARGGLAIGALLEACLTKNDPELATLRCEIDLPRYEYWASYHVDLPGRFGRIVAEVAKRCAETHAATFESRAI